MLKKTLKNINKNTFTPEFIQETNICNAVHITETNLKKVLRKCVTRPFTNVQILYPVHLPKHSSFISEVIYQNTLLYLGSFSGVSSSIKQLVPLLCSTKQVVTTSMTTGGSCCMVGCRTRNMQPKSQKQPFSSISPSS